MADVTESQVPTVADDKPSPKLDHPPGTLPKVRGAQEYGAYALVFFAGCVITLAVRYILRGSSIQLSPETFVSLVFTIAVGAASLVLAIVAISYGRISERVMTERADRSIDIQMSLFQKSLALQTQLFDKTMSTLESIGRSTGVTEQRLLDIHSIMQNPAYLKQIAGRAVEQTASELDTMGTGAKGEGRGTDFESHLAERLTKNIVEELSSRWESLTRSAQGAGAMGATMRPIPAEVSTSATPERPAKTFEEQAQEYRRQQEYRHAKRRLESMFEAAVGHLAGVTLSRNLPFTGGYWEYKISYKGKTVGVDVRMLADPQVGRMSSYDSSIQILFKSEEVDSLIFLFGEAPSEVLERHLKLRNNEVGGRVRFAVGTDEVQLQADLLAVLEDVAARLPAA